MPGVGTGLSAVVNLGTRLATILAGVSVVHDRDFLQFITAEQKVAGAGIVEVQKGVVVIIAIYGEEIGSARKTESAEVAVSAAGIIAHGDTGCGLRHIGDVSAWVRDFLDLFGLKNGGDVGVFGLQLRHVLGGHFNRRGARSYFQRGIAINGGSPKHRYGET